MFKKVVLPVFIVMLILVTPVLMRVPLIFHSAEMAYADFQDTTDQAEDMLMDPLILAGDKVVPLVLKEVQSPDMKLRRYAIHFLGNGRYSEVLPVLESILANDSELDYFRADALASIFNIDRDLGLTLAGEYSTQPGFLGRQASEITTGTNKWWVQRSFWEALRNVHH
ncbi:hypothetical protein [Aliamphritea ceti]|uniref:hypothetical protein n=1 Tax=Aliamphritea ceti TaxID=1524258 RepID=UPI0021C42699|nr:hypothetical protein [Aliamphritea ceti]